LSFIAFAQQDTSLIYLRFPTVPPFKLTKVPDSTVFTKDNLKKKKLTIIMIFSPDCEHCQQMIKEITANIKLFKKAQIVMATPLEFSYVKKFYEEYKIADYPNITMGRDPGYFLGTFYKVRSFPAIFIYNKKGNLVNWFTGEVELKKIVDSF
jgi:thioredoxin-related protein